MKQINNYICLVDCYRRPSLWRNTRGRYRVGAKTPEEAKKLLRDKIKFGSILVYYECDAERDKRNFAFETVLSTRRNLDLLIKAKSEGYFIRCFYFVTVDSSINFQRVENRVAEGGHDVPKDKIESRYNKALGLVPELIKVCDSINIWDNSTDRPYRIFQKKLSQVKVFENPVWSKEKINNLIE